MAKKTAKAGAGTEPSIEACLEGIETTIAEIEGGDLPLEEALARYEKALGLVRSAQGQLNALHSRLVELRGEDDLAAEIARSGEAADDDDGDARSGDDAE